ncbi:MAG: AAA domain-containing protein [Syntrophus sp. (in: bacteria)]
MDNTNQKQPDLQTTRERLTKLFEFLKAYTDLRYPPVRDINKQLRTLWFIDLPAHSSVELFRDTGKTSDESDESNIVLRLTRPVTTSCPPPPALLSEWIKAGWREHRGRIEVEVTRNVVKDGKTRIERFEENRQRPALLRDWQRQRDLWVTNERPTRQVLTFFQTIYEWYGIQEREGEKIEMLVGDGLLRCPDVSGDFRHPVLLQKVELEFYPEKKQPQFVFRKREQPPELYMEFLRALPEVNNQQLASCADELKKAEFSPLGDDDTEGFLRRLIQGLFPSSGNLIEGDEQKFNTVTGLWAKADMPLFNQPQSTDEKGGATIHRQPVIFMRQRRTGPGSIFDAVLNDIVTRVDFSPALLQILGLVDCAPPIQAESSTGIFSLGNEDEDILLSKPANKEQLEIAKQLARKDSVLVQGPPGTGKTHTIANLLGHLLAQGKRVLVTAHTPKALRVLREKIVPSLQPLCVSILQNDRQSQDDLQESVKKINEFLGKDDRQLEREANRLHEDRKLILKALHDAREKYLDARQDEIRDVVFAGKAIRPIEAAKRVKAGTGKDAWIPSPVTLGESMPASIEEVVALYQTNTRISSADERELSGFRPVLSAVPTPKEFQSVVEELNSLAAFDLRFRGELWNENLGPDDLNEFDRMLETASKTIEFLRDSTPWQLEAIQAGRDGDEARRVWVSLSELIETTWLEVQECYALVIEYGPDLSDPRPPHELLPLVEEIIEHSEKGNSFGMWTKLTKGHWFEFIEKSRVSNRALDPKNIPHLQAVRAEIRTRVLREDLLQRWERLIACQGGPACADLTEKPEQVCKQFVKQIQTCLEWHTSTWQPQESEFQRLDFRWSAYLESTPPETGANAELNRIRCAVLGDLGAILQSRRCWLRYKRLGTILGRWPESVPTSETPDALVTQRLRRAMREASPKDYQAAYEETERLKNLELDLARRHALLKKISRSAPAWVSAIENRHPTHNQPQPPGNPDSAWEWRQLYDELERRANVLLDELQQLVENLGGQLLEVTAQLVEKKTWVNQIRMTGSQQRQALGAYAAMRNRLTKTGKGVRDTELRNAARREMTTAKDAVPVWIMPLAEVAQTFDPQKTRFDVVIVDESSQCDPTSLFALYLGRQTIIVGDDEQVSPVAVGEKSDEVVKLINDYLNGVPFKELYDGATSIYDLAQIAFGGVIRLTEHFRCAPDIIAFSNNLSYKGEIKPLREVSSIPLSPQVIHYRVEGGRDRGDNVNEVEAEAIAALICAAAEQSEYVKNDQGKPTTFGVVSLVAHNQALKIDSILRQRLEPAEYQRRQILCGDSAQFQGDERDVMFLSVVDSPPAEPPLAIRQEGGKKIFKKRFNVATSRARNQMWIVHSLNHEVDLKVGDFRRNLIEHALDPNAWERELRKRMERTESIFEERVLRRLMEAHYNVLPQFQVGAYRIDLVVIGNGHRLAVECDGERWHGPEKIREDAERQAILERLGWKFVRIRGSLFFRDEDRALQAMFARLEELNITPEIEIPSSKPSAKAAVIEQVIRRAQELQTSWRVNGGT